MIDESLEYLNSFADTGSLAETLRRSCMNPDDPELRPLIARATAGKDLNSQLLKAMLPPPPKKKSGKGPKPLHGSKTKLSEKKSSK